MQTLFFFIIGAIMAASGYFVCRHIVSKWVDNQLKKGLVGYLIIAFVCFWVSGIVVMAIWYTICAIAGAIAGGVIAWIANMLPTTIAISLFALIGAFVAVLYARRERVAY